MNTPFFLSWIVSSGESFTLQHLQSIVFLTLSYQQATQVGAACVDSAQLPGRT